jgi:hypothetical protein
MLETIRTSWKAIIAFVGVYIAAQLPAIEVFVQDWVQSAVSAAFVAVAVWLKANQTA